MTLLQKLFVKGLIVVLPISLTLSLLLWITLGLEGLFGGWLKNFIGESHYVPGLGILIVFLLIIASGFLVGHYFIAQVYSLVNHLLEKVPLLNAVYRPVRDLIIFLGKKETEMGQGKIVRVELAPQVYTVGLLMRDDLSEVEGLGDIRKKLVAVYVPMSFMLGGYTILVEKEKIQETAMNVDQTINLAITGWVKSKEYIQDQK